MKKNIFYFLEMAKYENMFKIDCTSYCRLPSNIRQKKEVSRILISTFWDYPNFKPLINDIGDSISTINDMVLY